MKKFSKDDVTFYAEPGFSLGDEDGPAITTGLAHDGDENDCALLSVYDGGRLSEVVLSRDEALQLADDLIAMFALLPGGAK